MNDLTQTYYKGDYKKQLELLQVQAARFGLSQQQLQKASIMCARKIARFYNLSNKYDGNGKLRNLKEA